MAKTKSKTERKAGGKKAADLGDQFEQAFLAGLGALDNARKAGTKTFEKLVKEGEAYRKKTTARTEALIDEVQGTIRELAGDAQSRASGLLEQMRDTSQLDKLGSVFDARVDDAMKRLGMPRSKDIKELNRKLDRILANMESRKAPATRKKPVAKKRKKPAAKKRKVAKKTAKKTARKAPRKTAKKSVGKVARKTVSAA